MWKAPFLAFHASCHYKKLSSILDVATLLASCFCLFSQKSWPRGQQEKSIRRASLEVKKKGKNRTDREEQHTGDNFLSEPPDLLFNLKTLQLKGKETLLPITRQERANSVLLPLLTKTKSSKAETAFSNTYDAKKIYLLTGLPPK